MEFLVVEDWEHGTEFVFCDTLAEAMDERDSVPAGSVYVRVVGP